MKSKGTAYLLWVFGLFGLLGLPHFYLGKPLKGVVWFLTGGVFGVGALIDLFTLGGQVESRNTSEELKTIRANALSNSSKGIIGVVAMFVLFASCQKPDVVISECQKNAEEMLLPVAYQGENEVESCFALGAFQLFRTLTAPVTIADMKAALELNLNTAFTQDSFDVVLGTISSLPWDSSSLTTADISLINEIRSHLNPSPVLSACSGTNLPSIGGLGPNLASYGNPNNHDFTILQQQRVSSSTFEHAFVVEFDNEYACNIADVEVVNLLSASNTPSLTTFVLKDITPVNGKRRMAYYYVGWATDPYPSPLGAPGTQFSATFNFRDSSGAILISLQGIYGFA